MLLALTTKNMGSVGGVEAATLTTVLLVRVLRNAASLEAAWMYFILCGVGIARRCSARCCCLGVGAGAGFGGRRCCGTTSSGEGLLDPYIMTLAFASEVGFGTKVAW